ncbi:MAG: hypothetical protein ACRDIE_13300, partial [Chloroflexota bacterium]
MTGIWLVSYVALWVGMGAACFVLIRGLRSVMQLQQSLGGNASGELSIPPLEHDGPTIGSLLPDLAGKAENGFETVRLSALQGHGHTLLMFLTALCESCQHVVGPLNDLVADPTCRVRAVVIMQADVDVCQAFLRVFPLHVPL